MKVCDHIAEFLHEKGIKTVFGIIGAGNAALFDAIARHGKTEIVCVHHEQSAVGAAAFYGRTLGSCGVAIVTTGAGSSNAITGALAALMDSVPVLIISGNEPARYLDTDCRIVGVQGYKTEQAAKPFTKWSICYRDLFEPCLLHDAYNVATNDRPGPVWLDFPRDLFNAMV